LETWKQRKKDILRFDWMELGGPPIAAEPTRRGFGTALIESMFNRTIFEYAKTGLHCHIEAEIA